MSSDVSQMMMYDANKKSPLIAYLLWFFFGALGGHRFYAGRTGSAVVMLLLTVFCLITLVIGIGLLWWVIVAPWMLIDAFLIPGWIRSHNTSLAAKITL